MYGSVGKKQRFSGGSVTVQSEFTTVQCAWYYFPHSPTQKAYMPQISGRSHTLGSLETRVLAFDC